MAQPCVYDSIKALEKMKRHLFFEFLDITPETVYKNYLLNVVDPEMRQYCNINDQIPCSKEILEALLHCFTKQKCTIRYYICTFVRGAHEIGGLAYSVEEHVLYLSLPPVIYFDGNITVPKEYEMHEIKHFDLDIDDFAFVLRSSRGANGEVGPGHLMLMKYDSDLAYNLTKGFPASGLK